MKLFILDITEDDRNWVIANFTWLRDSFGYPRKSTPPILLTPEFFPLTFSTPAIEIENVVRDLCILLGLPREIIKIKAITDIRDMDVIPFEMGKKPLKTETHLQKGNHTVIFPNSYLKDAPDWLIHRLICEFVKIRLVESDAPYDTGGDDNDLFIYLAAVYHGFGVLLANSMYNIGRKVDVLIETKWYYVAEIPQPVMAFSLAVFAHLMNDHDPAWKDGLRSELRKMFITSLAYVNENVKDLYDPNEARANELFDEAEEHFTNGRNDEALKALEEILSISGDTNVKSVAHNNIGYHYSVRGDHRKAISSFEMAITMNPGFAYPVDNIGYSLILTGELEQGFSYLQKALAMDGNDIAFTYRNLALYYARKNDQSNAEGYFRKSFEQNTNVDLLEYHYAEFLLGTGDTERARQFLQMSVDKKEEPGILRARMLGWIE